MITRIHRKSSLLWVSIAIFASSLTGCVLFDPERRIELTQLKGWADEDFEHVWSAWRRSCDSKRVATSDRFRNVCERARKLDAPSTEQIRHYFEQNFVARRAVDKESGRRRGLITGYYEPILRGDRTESETYRYPLYGPPDDLIAVELGDIYPELANKRIRGLLRGKSLRPFYDRSQIDAAGGPLTGKELLWLDDPIDAFFLHVQGSGRVMLPDGTYVKVGYADQNGHRYVSIGRTLVERGELKLEEVSLQSIRRWLDEQNENDVRSVLNTNPSYVFFSIREDHADTPSGSLGVPLTPIRSVAVDKRYVLLGSPVWLETTLPVDGPEADPKLNRHPTKIRKLTFAQDTGGAIKGGVRADLFFGRGERAEWLAGHMKQKGRLWVLEPRADNGKENEDIDKEE